jgi:hypothetical protein
MPSPQAQSIHIRLPRDLYEAVRVKADAQGMSLNTWLVAVVSASHPGWVAQPEEKVLTRPKSVKRKPAKKRPVRPTRFDPRLQQWLDRYDRLPETNAEWHEMYASVVDESTEGSSRDGGTSGSMATTGEDPDAAGEV